MRERAKKKMQQWTARAIIITMNFWLSLRMHSAWTKMSYHKHDITTSLWKAYENNIQFLFYFHDYVAVVTIPTFTSVNNKLGVTIKRERQLQQQKTSLQYTNFLNKKPFFTLLNAIQKGKIS